MRALTAVPLLLAAALLAGCATAPPRPATPAPGQVIADIDAHLEREVTWGGMVIETVNFERYSEIEVLAFPLDRRDRPLSEQLDLGRFIVLRHGFLDPGIYAPGRFVTIHGRITGERRGALREVPYVWPEVDARELMLWPHDYRRSPVRFSIGIGVRL